MQYRNQNDFKWGSFDVYVKPNEVIISGILKKGGHSRFMRVTKHG
jgi:hypothetical protein